MVISVLATARFSQFNLGAGDGLVVGRLGSVITTTDTTHAIVGAGANALTVTGYVSASGNSAHAVDFVGGNHTIVVDSTGMLLSSRGIGINLGAGGNTLVNSGVIYGGLTGINIGSGAATSITNYNTIVTSGSDGIYSAGSKVNLYNVGIIDGAYDGVDTFTAQGAAIINTGSIIGRGDNALDLSNFDDVVINNGYMQGSNAVQLNSGNDLFDGRNGTQVGGVDGGAGSDTIYGGAGSDSLFGNLGVDMLYGGGGGDTINGGTEGDLIVGGAGGDVMSGGTGGDLFVFALGDQGDLITDLNAGGVRDGFDLRTVFDQTGFTGTDPRGAGILGVYQSGADTDVYLYGSFFFRIQGVVAAAIDDSYFIFQ